MGGMSPPSGRACRHPGLCSWGSTKHQRFLQELTKDGYARLHPIPEISVAIQRALKERGSAKRLDSLAPVRNALAKLL